MIVSASSRTDIPAFYSEWFFNRLKAGYFDVRNPFYPKSVSRIFTEDIDAFMFCTKNPLPMIDRLNEIEKPILMDVTITPYHREVEPGVPDKKEIIEGIRRIAEILGKDRVAVRYDPIFLSERYTVEYHLRAFEALCARIEGSAEYITLSILDEYKNTRKNQKMLGYRLPEPEELKRLAQGFAQSAAKHSIKVMSCNEKNVMKEWGIADGACFSWQKAYTMTGKVFKDWKARNCGCVEMADIGVYNTCRHYCRYCYANYDEKQIRSSCSAHDPESSLLTGHLEQGDEIRVRRK